MEIEIIKTLINKMISSTRSLLEELENSRFHYKETAIIYPSQLDEKVDEVCRDYLCIIRRLNIAIKELDELGDINIYKNESRLIGHIKEIGFQIQVNTKKMDNIIYEFKSIDDIDRSLLDNSDSFKDTDDLDDGIHYE